MCMTKPQPIGVPFWDAPMLCWETVSIGGGAARNAIRSGCNGEGWFQVLWAWSVMLLSGPRASRWPNVGSGIGSQCHSEFGLLTDRGEVGDGDMVFRKAAVFNFLTMALMWAPPGWAIRRRTSVPVWRPRADLRRALQPELIESNDRSRCDSYSRISAGSSRMPRGVSLR